MTPRLTRCCGYCGRSESIPCPTVGDIPAASVQLFGGRDDEFCSDECAAQPRIYRVTGSGDTWWVHEHHGTRPPRVVNRSGLPFAEQNVAVLFARTHAKGGKPGEVQVGGEPPLSPSRDPRQARLL